MASERPHPQCRGRRSFFFFFFLFFFLFSSLFSFFVMI
jgi:hypothetical protein